MKWLEDSVYSLIRGEPFFAHFILNSRIIIDNKRLPTAGAGVMNGSTVLIFNEEFMQSLTAQERVAVLKHEILHLLLDHHSVYKNDKINKELMNIAQDCAINQYITNIPEFGVTPEKLEKTFNIKLDRHETSEYYYNMILKEGKDAKGLKSLDEHEVEGLEKDGQAIKSAVQNTANKAQNQSKGNMSQELQKLLGNLNKSKLNWKQLLRNFVSKSISVTNENTRKKPNRRFYLDQPGRKKKRELTLGVCLDSSGSVSDIHYAEFLSEVQTIAKQVKLVYLVHADTQVNKVEVLDRNKKLSPERHGNGGTAYGPALNLCKEKKCDAIVYLGDMDCADIPENPNIPVLWVTVGSMTRPANFGSIIKLD